MMMRGLPAPRKHKRERGESYLILIDYYIKYCSIRCECNNHVCILPSVGISITLASIVIRNTSERETATTKRTHKKL